MVGLVRRGTAVLLGLLLAAPPANVLSEPTLGMLRGTVTLEGRPIQGVGLALIEVATGEVRRISSDARGAFEARVEPGEYVLSAESPPGLVVSEGPASVPIAAGEVASAHLDLLALPSALAQEEPLSEGARILHEPVQCFIAGEFPLLDALIEPAASVARARVYFKAAQGVEFFYVEMTPAATGFNGKLPRPTMAASPITYYLQATTTDFGETQTPEVAALVVESEEECEGKVAAIGPPGEVTVFSAATGAAVTPVGFAAGGLAIAAGSIALIIGGAAAAGITAAVTVFNPQPTPTATPTPTPTPTPEPTPEPTPVPTPEPTPEPPPPPGTPFR